MRPINQSINNAQRGAGQQMFLLEADHA